jgi:peroxiredoxin
VGFRNSAAGISWSGNERNHLFMGGLPGSQFADLSGVSGIDDPADGRGFAVLDFDRDGWLDVALHNLSAPRFRLFRNTMGDGDGGLEHRFVALRFVGGNQEAKPSKEWSSRDGFGTAVELELNDDLTVYREHQTESGYKTQNSTTMLVGIGKNEAVRSITVRWLSGKEQTMGVVPAGTLMTVFEDPSTSPSGEAFVLESYRKNPRLMTRVPSSADWKKGLLPEIPSKSRFAIRDGGTGSPQPTGKLNLYTTMATWCVACVEEMPEFRHLRAAFSQDELAMYGLPIDPEDDEATLQSWFEDKQPPYDLLIGLPEPEVARANEIVMSELRFDGVPAAIVTDASGRVVLARWGVPSVSDLRKLLWMSGAEGQAYRTSE